MEEVDSRGLFGHCGHAFEEDGGTSQLPLSVISPGDASLPQTQDEVGPTNQTLLQTAKISLFSFKLDYSSFRSAVAWHLD